MKYGVVVGTLTLSFWKEWRKFPPGSPSSRGVPGGLPVSPILLGEFCREQAVSPGPPTACHPSGMGKGLLEGAFVREGGREHTHSLLEADLCHLTLEGKRKPSSGSRPFFCAGASKCFHPNPKHFAKEDLLPRQHLPLWIFLWGLGSVEPGAEAAKASGKSGRVLTYLAGRSCGVAPCRPCPPPPGRPSLDPSGTVGSTGVSPERAAWPQRGAPPLWHGSAAQGSF